jgi:hypothetical protein
MNGTDCADSLVDDVLAASAHATPGAVRTKAMVTIAKAQAAKPGVIIRFIRFLP